MKIWKKLLMLCMTLSLGCGVAATAVACGEDGVTPPSTENSSSSSDVNDGNEAMDEVAFNAAIAATKAATNIVFDYSSAYSISDSSTTAETGTTYVADNKAYMVSKVYSVTLYSYTGNVDGKQYMWVSTDETNWTCEEIDDYTDINGMWVLGDILPPDIDFTNVTYDETSDVYTYVINDGTHITLGFKDGKISSILSVYEEEEFGTTVQYTDTLSFTYGGAQVGDLPPVPPVDGGEATEPSEYVYRISVQNETGFGFRNVSVSLYDGETKIATKKTNSLGNVNFTAEEVTTVGAYSIVIDEMPVGYTYAEDVEYTTVALSGTSTLIQIKPTGVIKQAMPANTRYDFGEVMYDFTLNLSDGTQFTLSEELETKNAVLINFWATWCGPCQQEFPAMHNAATLYSDDVTVLALSTTDGNQAIESFKKTSGFTSFKMGMAPKDLISAFSVGGIPHSIIVDRYGVVSFNHVGSMTATSDFTTRFDIFNAEDYQSIVLGAPTADPDVPPTDDGNGLLPPTKEVLDKKPTEAQIKEVLGADDNFSFRFQEDGAEVGSNNYDEYSWPWLVGDDGEYLYAPNSNMHNTYATLYVDFTANAGDVLCFDYLLGSEDDCDILYVTIDGTPIHQLSGYHTKAWQTNYSYVFQEGESGEHEMVLIFLKDNDKTAYEDVVQIKNLRIVSLDEIRDAEGVDANIFRYAASGLNTAEDAKTQYTNYVTPVYNEEDGYYHVGAENGPILFANMLRASQWSNNSVWLLAYNDYVVDEDGSNYRAAIEYYAWEANNSIRMLGYTAVTKELRQLLEITVSVVTVDQKWNGPNHANEWLECCIYYDHYGATDPMEDPMRGITFAGAIEMQEGDNEVEVLFEMVPRGFKYKFTPTKSGVYHVYSTGTYDTMVFLTSKTEFDKCPIQDRLTNLNFFGIYNDKLFMDTLVDENGNEYVDYNFEFYYTFEANETYYMLFTTYNNAAATYNVTIDYHGETYSYLQFAASNLYSANENTGAEYLPDAVDYYYSDPAEGGDGYYHEEKTGSILYLDVNRPTFFNQDFSLYDICRSAIKNNIPVEDRAFYVNGVDYTETLMAYCNLAMFPEEDTFEEDGITSKIGFIAVDQELMTLLQTITMKRYEGVEKTWLMMCYYFITLG
ncbi:MAG: TlpA family protein disulfide reductase [Clostridiales bacterium]|nr:TlpA family protein disulfide reductase [Clostridiales bacterium]